MPPGSFPLPPGFSPQGNLLGASSGTIGSINQTTQAVQALSVNPGRNGATFYNNTNVGTLLLAYHATTASLATFTQKLAPSGSWSMPTPAFCGAVTVTWDAPGAGNLKVTETS